MVLRTHHANAVQNLGPLVNALNFGFGQTVEFEMIEVDSVAPQSQLLGQGSLCGAYQQIDISIGTQSRVGVGPRSRPPLHQDRLDARSPQQLHHFAALLLAHGVPNCLQTKRLVQIVRLRNIGQRRTPQAPPGQAGRTRIVQVWLDRLEFRPGQVSRLRRRPPCPRQHSPQQKGERFFDPAGHASFSRMARTRRPPRTPFNTDAPRTACSSAASVRCGCRRTATALASNSSAP